MAGAAHHLSIEDVLADLASIASTRQDRFPSEPDEHLAPEDVDQAYPLRHLKDSTLLNLGRTLLPPHLREGASSSEAGETPPATTGRRGHPKEEEHALPQSEQYLSIAKRILQMEDSSQANSALGVGDAGRFEQMHRRVADAQGRVDASLRALEELQTTVLR